MVPQRRTTWCCALVAHNPCVPHFKWLGQLLSASQTLLLEELLFLISHIHFSLAILIVGLELINDLAF